MITLALNILAFLFLAMVAIVVLSILPALIEGIGKLLIYIVCYGFCGLMIYTGIEHIIDGSIASVLTGIAVVPFGAWGIYMTWKEAKAAYLSSI
jgi:hypothetical protein